MKKENIDINSQIFKLAVTAAKAAVSASGTYLKKQFELQNQIISFNGSHEKIEDDVVAENIILDTLKKYIPTFSHISEETQNHTEDEIQFIIDPIEGTSNYVRGIPFFGTQIAIMYQKTLAASFIYEPIRDILYYASLGQGAYMNTKKLNCNLEQPLKQTILSGGAGTNTENKLKVLKKIEKLMPHMRSVRIYGSTGLELAYVSQGKLGAHVNIGSKVYDFTPGVLLVREAGGEVYNLEGKEWTVNDVNMIASSKNHISEVLSLLNQ